MVPRKTLFLAIPPGSANSVRTRSKRVTTPLISHPSFQPSAKGDIIGPLSIDRSRLDAHTVQPRIDPLHDLPVSIAFIVSSSEDPARL